MERAAAWVAIMTTHRIPAKKRKKNNTGILVAANGKSKNITTNIGREVNRNGT